MTISLFHLTIFLFLFQVCVLLVQDGGGVQVQEGVPGGQHGLVEGAVHGGGVH